MHTLTAGNFHASALHARMASVLCNGENQYRAAAVASLPTVAQLARGMPAGSKWRPCSGNSYCPATFNGPGQRGLSTRRPVYVYRNRLYVLVTTMDPCGHGAFFKFQPV